MQGSLRERGQGGTVPSQPHPNRPRDMKSLRARHASGELLSWREGAASSGWEGGWRGLGCVEQGPPRDTRKGSGDEL